MWIRNGVYLLLPRICKFNNVYLYTRATQNYTDNILESTNLNQYFQSKKYRNDCKVLNCKNLLDFNVNISKSYLIDDKKYNQCTMCTMCTMMSQNLYHIKPFIPTKFYIFNFNCDNEFYLLFFYIIWLNIKNDLSL